MQLTQLLHRAAQTNPRGIATQQEGRQRTWTAFRDRVARLAAGLRGLGLERGDRVAILALNSDRYLEFLFAAPWAGLVFVPVNTRLAAPEVAFWIDDSESRALFIDDAFLPMLPALAGETGSVRHIVYMGEGDTPAGLIAYESLVEGRGEAEDARCGGDDLAGIYYTGGTTGRSKGVMLSHGNLICNALNVIPALGFATETKWLHAAPMFHMADGTATFGVTMAAGGHAFIPKFEPTEVLEAIARYGASDAVFVPTMINMLVNHPEIARYDLSSLRGILYGASPMPESLITKAMEVMPHVRFHQGYGQTECAPLLTVLEPKHHVPGGPKLKSAGQAALAVEICIMDAEDRPLPPGDVGEICARGPNVMLGYWRQPELTAETIRDGWIHTGDGGYMDEEGFVYVVDRVKDMIISGGENIYSAEVENAIYRHPAVAECAVIGIPSEQWGEAVHAIVRLKEDQRLSGEALIAHCRSLIAAYKCPRSVGFVAEPLPVSGAGKILKAALRKPFWEGQQRQVN